MLKGISSRRLRWRWLPFRLHPLHPIVTLMLSRVLISFHSSGLSLGGNSLRTAALSTRVCWPLGPILDYQAAVYLLAAHALLYTVSGLKSFPALVISAPNCERAAPTRIWYSIVSSAPSPSS